MPSFDSAGVSIHYQVFGAGQPIVLVHGLLSDIEGNWVAPGWIDALAPVRQVIAMDCRGHGQSGKPHDVEAYANEEMSLDVLRLLDHLAIEKADLFGYSMGSEIAVPLLLRHGERLKSVILGGFGDFAGDWEAVTPEVYLVDDPDSIEHPFARGVRMYADSVGADLKAIAAFQAGYRPPLDGAPVIGDEVPVLVVNGADDDVGSLDGLFAAVPHARLIEISGRDHLTVVGDPRFKQAVLDFLT